MYAFTTINIERANKDPRSICKISIAEFDKGTLTNTKEWTIKPLKGEFESSYSYSHGINQRDVENSPSFNQVWQEIYSYLHGKFIIAFNANYMINSLAKSFDYFKNQKESNFKLSNDKTFPIFTFICLSIIYRNTFKTLSTNKLEELSKLLNIDSDNKNSMSLAIATGELFNSLFAGVVYSNFLELISKTNTMLGETFKSKISYAFNNDDINSENGSVENPKEKKSWQYYIPCLSKLENYGENKSISFEDYLSKLEQYDFIAIDFETANSNIFSICSIGLAFVKDLEIVKSTNIFVKPPDNYYSPHNTKIHGITSEVTSEKPMFPEVWKQIKNLFNENIPIVAHNADFDMAALKAILNYSEITSPKFTYYDSMIIPSFIFEDLESKSLKGIAERFSIDISNHHNSEYDAVTCATIVIESIKKSKMQNFKAYTKFYSIEGKFFFIEPNYKYEPKKTIPSYPNSIKYSEYTPNESADKSNELYGKSVVVTGNFMSFTREEILQILSDKGAIVRNSVTSKTNILIVGIQSSSRIGKSGVSAKEKKAESLIDAGLDIKILSEDEFNQIIQ